MPRYNVITEDGEKILKDYSQPPVTKAEDIVYNNTESGLAATNTQGAIDELSVGLTEINESLSDITFSGSVYQDGTVTKHNHHVSVNIRVKPSATHSANSAFVLATSLPVPTGQINFPILIQGASSATAIGYIDTSGNLNMYTYNSLDTHLFLIISVGYDTEE